MTTHFTSLDDRLVFLYGLQRLGIKTGLEHTRALLTCCGDPQRQFPALHIAGTNGKGSTSALLASILRSAGYRVGLYTSPHLIRFHERIRVDGQPVPDQAIIAFVDRYQPDIESIQSTFFETTTALAFSWFARQKVDVAVIETGLGGRLDSTNVLQPELAIITPVAMDHSHILGPTLTAVAREKAGIIKPGIPVISAAQHKVVATVLRKEAKEKQSALTFIPSPTQVATGRTTTRFCFNKEWYSVALPGNHQAANAALATVAARMFDQAISPAVIRRGLATVVWPGRMQCLATEPLIYYDVAHNAHGIKAALATLRQISNVKPVGLLALKGDKDCAEIAKALPGKFARLIVSSLPEEDLVPAEALAQLLRRYDVAADPVESFSEAVAKLKSTLAGKQAGLIFGSHYIGKAVFSAFDFPFDTGRI